MLTWIAGILRRYLNSFYKKNFTVRFIELWKKTSWTFDEYFYCHNEYYDGHESRVAKQTFVMILSLIAAGVSFFTEVFFLCILFILFGTLVMLLFLFGSFSGVANWINEYRIAITGLNGAYSTSALLDRYWEDAIYVKNSLFVNNGLYICLLLLFINFSDYKNK